MRKRVEETLDLLGIAGLRGRTLRTLSGGQQQRVAIGSVLAAGSRVLVLDEPTSALDPTSAEEVLGAVLRLVHDLGVTAVIAEHRMERVVEYADRVVLLTGDGRVEIGAPAEMMARTTVAPPVVGLAKLLDWQPLPLSVRSARRLAGAAAGTAGAIDPTIGRRAARPPGQPRIPDRSRRRDPPTGVARRPRVGEPGRSGTGRCWWPDGQRHRRQLRPDGRGRRRRPAGRPRRGGRADGPQRLRQVQPAVGAHRGRPAQGGSRRDRRGGHRPADATRRPGPSSGWCRRPRPTCSTWKPSPPSAPPPMTSPPSRRAVVRALLDRLVPGIDLLAHPRDLSEGQRLSVVLAVQLTARTAGAAARRADPRPGLRRQTPAGRDPRPNSRRPGGRCWCPPTTSNSWRPSRAGSW